ncbi:hypothetical protein EDB80DRAFT_769111 [Ilyonectria destructans]|nr:hypothetical protein EDB80DRAFT_769111 [Ilyonectria destructans]
MSTALPTREKTTPGTSSATPSTTSPAAPPLLSPSTKHKRVLACVLCHQRKVKCERKFPCSNCVRSGAQCVPTTVIPRPRRRRFPERVLLERLRHYEDLLRQNNVSFEPLHKDCSGAKAFPNLETNGDSDDEQPSTTGADSSSLSPTAQPDTPHETRDFWHAIKQGFLEPKNQSDSSNEDTKEGVAREAWDELFDNTDHLLLGSRKTSVDLSALQPEPVHIFRLWQTYLDNVNPLLKVTHTPSLQPRIIQAMGNMADISPSLEALMFSIYCMSIHTIPAEECQALFGSPKGDLVMRYQFGAQQALANCGYLRTSDRICLTALYLYLVSVSSSTNPRSLSSILGVAVRIARRMGIHNEMDNAKCTPLEAEMRRRLWWSLIVFDSRIGELADHKSTGISPIWDCRLPLNANESELRPEMKELPPAELKCTEALFVVVRSEMSDFLRHTAFYLDFSSPALKPLAKNAQHGPIPEGSELDALEETIENKYFKHSDPEIPLHYLTIWASRASLAKWRIVEYYWRYSGSSEKPTEADVDSVVGHAFTMLESDTKLMSSPLTKGYHWLLEKYFPLPAYMHIARDLRRRPVSKHAARAWDIMSDSFDARFVYFNRTHTPLFKFFNKIILKVWEAREVELTRLGEPITPPRIISRIRSMISQIMQDEQEASPIQPEGIIEMGINDLSMPMPMGLDTNHFPYAMDWQNTYGGTGTGMYPPGTGQSSSGADMNQFDWATMIWGLGDQRG